METSPILDITLFWIPCFVIIIAILLRYVVPKLFQLTINEVTPSGSVTSDTLERVTLLSEQLEILDQRLEEISRILSFPSMIPTLSTGKLRDVCSDFDLSRRGSN